MVPGVALTFDDGPDPAGTPAVLAALARADVRATFFVLGAKAVAEPDLLQEILAAGHAVELHGHEHLRHTTASRAQIAADTERALDVLSGFGVTSKRWRTPWGAIAPWTAELAAAHGLELVGWDLDPEDWAGPPAPAMLSLLTGDPMLVAGAIVLLHDGCGPGALRASCRETARLVEPLAEALRARGLEPGPLPAPDAARRARGDTPGSPVAA